MIAWMRTALVLTTWWVLIADATAQSSAAPRKVYTNRQFFSVPIKIDDADRARIAAIKFYVRTPGGNWTVSDTGNAKTGRFNYNAGDDGEYQFSFATVDSSGRETPNNVEREAPRLLVLVDTKPPEFMVAPVSVASGQSYVQCTMKDANPDMATVTAEGEASDGTFHSLLPVDANVPGFFRVPATGMPSRVRVSGKDKAGNAAVAVMAIETGTPPSPMITQTDPRKDPAMSDLPMPKPAPAAPKDPNPEPISGPTPKNVGSGLILPGMSQPGIVNATGMTPAALPKPAAPAFVPALPAMPRVAEKPPASLPPVQSPTDQVINSQRCVLNYAIDGLAPAAVRMVEAYATTDGGKSWQKIGDDPDRTSPIELTLPGEGRFGIVIVIAAAGRPGHVPAAGETPDWWIEVDTIPPEVTLESATPGTGDDAGMLILKWHVNDKNMKSDAVEFAWANAPEGPWNAIAKGLRAEGLYRWPVPREAGSKAYLKIEAQDKAGNIGRAATAQPVSVEVNRPRAKVLGINPAAMKQ